MQLTVRMPDEYSKKLKLLSKKMGLKRSDIVRLALRKLLHEIEKPDLQNPYQKVSHLVGLIESGVKDLGQHHRHYLIRKIRRES